MPTHEFGTAKAEREGFEPSNPCRLRAFQARALGQTMRPLQAEPSQVYPRQRLMATFGHARDDAVTVKPGHAGRRQAIQLDGAGADRRSVAGKMVRQCGSEAFGRM